MKRKGICLFSAACLFFTTLPSFTPVHGQSKGTDIDKVKGSLVIVGGALGSSNKDVYEKFIELSGGVDKAKIGILPTASSKLQSTRDFTRDLISYGIPESSIEIIPISKHDFKKTDENEAETWKNNENNEDIVNQISKYTGIWMVGGDQTLITDALINEDGTNSKALDEMWNIYEKGAVLGGSSAGAAVMSDLMLAGGDSLGTLTNGFTSSYTDMSQQEYGPSYVVDGLGFFPYGTVDQHFDEKARLGRLILTAYEKQKTSSLAFGVDEDTALVVKNDTDTLEVVGRGGITIVDISEAKKNPNSALTDMKNIRLSYLKPKDVFDLKSEKITINPHKASTTGYEYYNFVPTPHRAILDSQTTLVDFIANTLLDNEGASSVKSYLYDENGRGFQLSFIQDEKSEGYYGSDSYSFTDVILNIEPIKVDIAVDITPGNYQSSKHSFDFVNADPDDIKGNLVIVGGALDPYNKDIYMKFIELAGGVEKAKIGILPTASEGLSSSQYYFEDFTEIYGVPSKNVVILPLSKAGFKEFPEGEKRKWAGNENSDEVVKTIEGLTGIFMVGGEQERITSTLYNEDGTNSKALDALWKIYKEGAVLSGSSAGAAVMSDAMLNGGDTFGALRDGYTENVLETYGDDIVKSQIIKGLGFFPYGIVDQHFVKRNRYGRLIQATYEAGITDKLSFGIDENTALVVYNSTKTAEVIGETGVVVIDMTKATTDKAIPRTNFKDIRYSYLANGDGVNLSNNTYTFSNHKVDTKGYEYNEYIAPPNTGVLTNHGRLNNFLAYGLVDNLLNNSIESIGFDNEGNGFKVTFRKVEESNGYWGYADGQKDDYSVVNVAMDITPIKAFVKLDNTQNVSPMAVHIAEGDITLQVGDSKALTTIIDGTNALNKEVVWKSSDESVASIETKGVITGLKEGTATITVTTVDGGKSDSIEVTVTKAEEEVKPDTPKGDDNKPSNTDKPNKDKLPQTGSPIGTGTLYLISMGTLVIAYILLKKEKNIEKNK